MEAVKGYAARVGVQPSTVVQKAKAGNGSTWAKWESREGFPTLKVADRVLEYIAQNPAPAEDANDGAEGQNAA